MAGVQGLAPGRAGVRGRLAPADGARTTVDRCGRVGIDQRPSPPLSLSLPSVGRGVELTAADERIR